MKNLVKIFSVLLLTIGIIVVLTPSKTAQAYDWNDLRFTITPQNDCQQPENLKFSPIGGVVKTALYTSNVRYSPSTDSAIVGVVYKGERVMVEYMGRTGNNNWYWVKYWVGKPFSGVVKQGWIRIDLLGK